MKNKPLRYPFLLTCAMLAIGLALPLTFLQAQEARQPASGRLMSRFAKDVSPENVLPEYPRPQMQRRDWQNLNGLWDYALTVRGADTAPTVFNSQILVPYPYESALSGVGKPSIPDQKLWYRRKFAVPLAWKGQKVLLHFGAVNHDAAVMVNGKIVGSHYGGFDGFSFDITSVLREGTNELVVATANALSVDNENSQAIGKQRLRSGGVLYTAATGIWQTVWLEPVPIAHIDSLKITPDVDASQLHLTVLSKGNASIYTLVKVSVMTNGKSVASSTGIANAELVIPLSNAKLWSPDAPFLYDLKVTLGKGPRADSVDSYFAMRKISLGKDAQGRTRIFLNNKFVFQVGALDQGYWPDGIFTAPTDQALRSDIETAKTLGFNLLRKHAKVEPDRWYYHCDKLGMLVWQDMPQMFGASIDGQSYGLSDAAKAQWLIEWKREIAEFYNHPSIVVWTLFNEGWGQHDTEQLALLTRRLDPTRLINAASGGYNQVVDGKMSQFRLPTPPGVGDVNDTHTYPEPSVDKPDATRALVCGEFGGISMRVPDHVWSAANFGYGTIIHDGWHLTERYQQLLKIAYNLRDIQGASAVVYTQISDVEEETNGMLTYDRAVMKPLPNFIKAANGGKFLALPPRPVNQDLVPTSQDAPQMWLYTTQKPADGWEKSDFDTSSWQSGAAPFGHEMDGVRTDWQTSDIWMRRRFTLPNNIPTELSFSVLHDEDAEIYLNGVLAATLPGFNNNYDSVPMNASGRTALKPGQNTLAVHVHQTLGGQGIDVGIISATPQTAVERQSVVQENKISRFVMGADLSLLQTIQDHGVQYKEAGQVKDPLMIFKDHGCEYVRLRLFVNPNGKEGQVNTLPYTLKLARRVKAARLKFYLDYHYSDDWADPGHQITPAAWKNLSHAQLVKRVYTYTRDTLAAFKREGCAPEIVSVGNEVSNGMMWPDGGPLNSDARWDAFADLLKAGIRAVREIDPKAIIMIHDAQGGNKDIGRWFYDNLQRRGVAFDVIGLSYYPFWHGSFADLTANLASLARTYKKDIYIAETSYDTWGGDKGTLPYPITPEGQKTYLNELIRTVAATPDGHGKGVFYWAPEWIQGDQWGGPGWSGTWENRALFDHKGNMLPAMQVFEAKN